MASIYSSALQMNLYEDDVGSSHQAPFTELPPDNKSMKAFPLSRHTLSPQQVQRGLNQFRSTPVEA